MMTLLFLLGFAMGLVLRWLEVRELRAERDDAEHLASWRGELLRQRGRATPPLCECEDDQPGTA